MSRFEQYNLESPQRLALWREQRGRVREILEEIRQDTFDCQAEIASDIASRFSGLARPNLALRPLGEMRGFIAVCVSPKQADQLRVLASNGHTATRLDAPPAELAAIVERGLRRWLSQPLLDPGAIRARQDAVQAFHNDTTLRLEIRERCLPEDGVVVVLDGQLGAAHEGAEEPQPVQDDGRNGRVPRRLASRGSDPFRRRRTRSTTGSPP